MSDFSQSEALRAYGLTEVVVSRFEAESSQGDSLARVVRADRGFAWVRTESSELLVAVPKSLARDPESAPVTGDWVVVDTSRLVLASVLERSTEVRRRAAGRSRVDQILAANVDVVFVVMGLDADFNVRRLERYLALVGGLTVEVVVVLTKAGLVPDAELRRNELARTFAPHPVCAIDVFANIDPFAVLRHLGPGRTGVLLGSSGVGKSTLLNFLIGSQVERTNVVRDRDGRGQHTTTARVLHLLRVGGLLMDTPGMRELALGSEPLDVAAAFPDIAELSDRCRFRDCLHDGGPGCAVAEAIRAGLLDEVRLSSFRALSEEAAAACRGEARAAGARPARRGSRRR